MANVSTLLHNSKDGDDLLAKLEPLAQEKDKLLSARTDIRDRLRSVFSQLPADIRVQPRFFTQGSYAYKTLNRRPVPLEMDMDDGAYLPLSFIQEATPSVASDRFFAVVDATLETFAAERSWKHIKKDTCSRLILDPSAHFDVPLYAIPDKEFEELTKMVEARKKALLLNERGAAFAFDSMDDWNLLPDKKVLLAHRTEGWKTSDPRKIHKWFLDSIDLYGEKLRRICRYLKAWRDNHPDIHDVSSILLMTCAWMSFEETTREKIPSREDLTLLQVAQDLPVLLSDNIPNPADKSESLSDRLDAKTKGKAIALAGTLSTTLRETIHTCYNQHLAVQNMRDLFGDRIPNRPDLVEVSHPQEKVFAQPRETVPAPAVGRSKSG